MYLSSKSEILMKIDMTVPCVRNVRYQRFAQSISGLAVEWSTTATAILYLLIKLAFNIEYLLACFTSSSIRVAQGLVVKTLRCILVAMLKRNSTRNCFQFLCRTLYIPLSC